MTKETFSDFYLNLTVRKSIDEKVDENGNYIFEVEASNENIDLQNQIVLQEALLKSKHNFLSNGVVSCDHLHKTKDENGKTISDNSMVIGEPIDVKTDGSKTIVVGKLYSTNKKAQEFIDLLKAGSTRVKASVGGMFPKVVEDAKTGVEKITSIFWNDLALTVSPVNNTVGAAIFAKSMNSNEFVELYKSLEAGGGTDSANFRGGRALIPENLGEKTLETSEKDVIRSLIAALETGEVKNNDQAERFLISNGLDKDQSREVVREIINQGGKMMKKSFSEIVGDLLKSLKKDCKDDEIKKTDDSYQNDADQKEEDDDEKKDSENEQSVDTVDATDVLKSLDSEIKEIRKSLALSKSLDDKINDIGGAVTQVAEMVALIANQKIPPSSALYKSIDSSDVMKKSNTSHGVPTAQEFEKIQETLIRCVNEGKLDITKSSLISSSVQKCMSSGTQIKPEYVEFLKNEMGGK
ncbi:MAG: hypothetical protein ACRC4W_00110 [Treponemataceae bacterium]